jgi:hypothetical protein
MQHPNQLYVGYDTRIVIGLIGVVSPESLAETKHKDLTPVPVRVIVKREAEASKHQN